MHHIILLPLFLLSCKPPKPTLEPVYNCTNLTPMQQEDMSALMDGCEGFECERKVMALYCDEEAP